MDELVQLNGIADPNQVPAGTSLFIPGLEGYSGELVTQPMPFGESLQSISRRYKIPKDLLARLNRISSPTDLYAGYSLALPASGEVISQTGRTIIGQEQSLLELSVLRGVNPWQIVRDNDLSGTWQALPGDVLLLTANDGSGPAGLPDEITAAEIDRLPFLQGKTSEIRLSGESGMKLGGSVLDHPLHFFEDGESTYVALQGVHAMLESGLYPLTLSGVLTDGTPFTYTQNVLVQPVDYPYDQPLVVNPTTIDPAVTRPEDAQWNALAGPATPERLWSGKFRLPSPLDEDYCLETNECWTSTFGNRRSYNGSPYNAFHTGLDIAGGSGTRIYAPAAGVVVFAGPLTVRGNATMIDHGWGVYTGYMHQSDLKVKVGDRVEPGEVIGIVGGTGRVEGPHLHWEVWAGGVQVDPLDWLERVFP
jgi:murein DD-endopeptidase MepM/ murein hydrolase activator NlpD